MAASERRIEHLIEVVELDDETEQFRLDGKLICTSTHDEHGWSGMELARDVVEGLAKQLNIPYIRRTVEDTEENL